MSLPTAKTPSVYVLHENAEWLPPLREGFESRKIPYVEWFLNQESVDLEATPPEGVFYNRMSASSHTRDHRYAPELTSVVLAWLTAHNRTVVNGPSALDLETNKIRQYALLKRAGLRTPETVAAIGRERLLEAAQAFPLRPFIIKPNRGGKGAGVSLFETVEALEEAIADGSIAFEGDNAPIDGIWLVQRYVATPEPFITRAEFIGRRFYYAVRVDTSDGFELCPADMCALPTAGPKFRILDEPLDPDLLARLEQFLELSGIDVTGIEFATDEAGRHWVYDVNTNTNYNGEAEAAAGASGMGRLAAHLGELLFAEHPTRLARAG